MTTLLHVFLVASLHLLTVQGKQRIVTVRLFFLGHKVVNITEPFTEVLIEGYTTPAVMLQFFARVEVCKFLIVA